MTPQHHIVEIETDRGHVCRAILEALPDWFGIPEAIEEYVRAVEAMPMLVSRRNGQVVGMVALNRVSDATVDMHVIGVLKAHQGEGIGTALVEAAASRARAEGAKLLSVKTLGPSHADPYYAKTREFYLAAGFLPVEEFKDFWGKGMPCLVMVRPLD